MTTKPASTGVQVVLPLAPLYELGGHGTHSLATTSCTVPAAQGWHAKVEPPAAYCGTEPAAHVQASSAGEPGNDVEPSGHERQEVPSAAAYVLAWHGLQLSAPRAEKEP